MVRDGEATAALRSSCSGIDERTLRVRLEMVEAAYGRR
jgi:hypothetical protein